MARILVLCVVLALAGCAHAPTPAAKLPGNTTHSAANVWSAHPAIALANGTRPALANFTYAGPLTLEGSFDGSFGPQQTCLLGSCLTSDSLVHIDISSVLPKSVFLSVTASLKFTGVVGGAFMSPRAPAGDRLMNSGSSTTSGNVVDKFVLIRSVDGPVEMVVGRSSPDVGGSFTVRVVAEVQATTFNEVEAVGVSVGSGASAIAIEAATAGGDVRVWDATDRFEGNHTLGTLLVFPVAGPGEYVLQFSRVSAVVRIYALQPNDTAAPQLRVLGFKRTALDPHSVDGADGQSWSFQSAGTPLGAGVDLTGGTQSQGLFTTFQSSLRLVGADGTDAGGFDITPFCICGGTWEASTYGWPHALAGEYKVSYGHTASSSVVITPFVDEYVR